MEDKKITYVKPGTYTDMYISKKVNKKNTGIKNIIEPKKNKIEKTEEKKTEIKPKKIKVEKKVKPVKVKVEKKVEPKKTKVKTEKKVEIKPKKIKVENNIIKKINLKKIKLEREIIKLTDPHIIKNERKASKKVLTQKEDVKIDAAKWLVPLTLGLGFGTAMFGVDAVINNHDKNTMAEVEASDEVVEPIREQVERTYDIYKTTIDNNIVFSSKNIEEYDSNVNNYELIASITTSANLISVWQEVDYRDGEWVDTEKYVTETNFDIPTESNETRYKFLASTADQHYWRNKDKIVLDDVVVARNVQEFMPGTMAYEQIIDFYTENGVVEKEFPDELMEPINQFNVTNFEIIKAQGINRHSLENNLGRSR